jgi:hypothetical protein
MTDGKAPPHPRKTATFTMLQCLHIYEIQEKSPQQQFEGNNVAMSAVITL